MYKYGHKNNQTYNYALNGKNGNYKYAKGVLVPSYTINYSTWSNGTHNRWVDGTFNNIDGVWADGKYGYARGGGNSPLAEIKLTASIAKPIGFYADSYYSFDWACYAKAAISSNPRVWKASVSGARFYPSTRRFVADLYWYDPAEMTMSTHKLSDGLYHNTFPLDMILPDTVGFHTIYHSEQGFHSGDYNYSRIKITIDHKTDDILRFEIQVSAYGEEHDYAECWCWFYPSDVTTPHPMAFTVNFNY